MDKLKYVLLTGLIALFLFSIFATSETGFAQENKTGGETWVNHTKASLKMDSLWVIITVTVKNKADRPYYFKIGQAYHDHLMENETIKWLIEWTDPPAVKMAKSRFPELGGDYGWEIDPGQTRTVKFKLKATGPFGDELSYISRAGEDPTYYWPLVSEPGLYTSWFLPNELETLNTDLKIVNWTGTFGFSLYNVDYEPVYGIVRAPIVPSLLYHQIQSSSTAIQRPLSLIMSLFQELMLRHGMLQCRDGVIHTLNTLINGLLEEGKVTVIMARLLSPILALLAGSTVVTGPLQFLVERLGLLGVH